MEALLNETIEIIKAAGKTLMRYYSSDYNMRYKFQDNPVTDADFAADTLLHQDLTSLLPEAGWLSEESVDKPDRLHKERIWAVDPLDGTKEFIMGVPEFAISVALVENGRPILGVIYNPPADELFYGTRAKGMFFNGTRIKVTDRTQIDGALIDASRSECKYGEFKPFKHRFQIQIIGSTAYKLARVAAGLCDASWSRGPKNEWDICAGVLLVKEAGGQCVDLNDAHFSFNRQKTLVNGFIADNGKLHKGIINVLSPYGAARR